MLPPPRVTTIRSTAANTSLGVASSRMATALPATGRFLHAHRVDQNLQPRRGTTEVDQYPAPACSAWRGDHSDAPGGNLGNGRFRSGRGNNPSALVFALGLGSLPQQADSARLSHLNVEPASSARFENRATRAEDWTCAPSASGCRGLRIGRILRTRSVAVTSFECEILMTARCTWVLHFPRTEQLRRFFALSVLRMFRVSSGAAQHLGCLLKRSPDWTVMSTGVETSLRFQKHPQIPRLRSELQVERAADASRQLRDSKNFGRLLEEVRRQFADLRVRPTRTEIVESAEFIFRLGEG